MSLLNGFGLFEGRKTTLIFDVGTSSVGGAIARYNEPLPRLMFHTRWRGGLNDYPDFERYFGHTLNGIGEVARTLIKNKDFERPKRLVCFLPSILYFSEIRTAKITYPEPKEITPKLVEDVITKEVEAFQKETLFRKDIPEGMPVLLEKKLVNIRLNGYQTPEPYGKKACEVSVSLFLSYTPDTILKKIQHRIQQFVHTEKIEFYGAIQALYELIEYHFKEQKHYILYNLTGEITELLIVRDGKLSQIVTYPFGKKTLIRKLKDALKVSHAEAETLLRLYLTGAISRTERPRVKEALDMVRKEWKVNLSLVLDRIAGHMHLPGLIFLANGGSYSDLFKNWLVQERRELLLPEASVRVSILKEELLARNFYTSSRDYADDSMLAFETIFINEHFMR